MDAWLLLYIGMGLYMVSQVLFTRSSILAGTAVGQILCLLLPSLIFVKWKTGSVYKALRIRPVSAGIILRVVILAVTFMGFAELLQMVTQPLIERYFPDQLAAIEAIMKMLTPTSATGLFGNLLVVGLIAPICEEVFFRGAFQGTLEKRGPTRAILISALVFALIHLNPYSVFGIFVIGIGLGYLTWRTQSLWPAILWHVINNSLVTVLLYFKGDSYTMPLWLNAILAVLFVIAAWEFTRHTRLGSKREATPLVNAPKLLSRKFSHLLTASGVMLTLAICAGLFCFGLASLGSNFLEPKYSLGDIAVYLRGPAFNPEELQVGDVVVYHLNEGNLRYSRILAIDSDQITVIGRFNAKGDRINEVIDQKQLAGKFIWSFDPGEAIKQLTETNRPPAPTSKSN